MNPGVLASGSKKVCSLCSSKVCSNFHISTMIIKTVTHRSRWPGMYSNIQYTYSMKTSLMSALCLLPAEKIRGEFIFYYFFFIPLKETVLTSSFTHQERVSMIWWFAKKPFMHAHTQTYTVTVTVFTPLNTCISHNPEMRTSCVLAVHILVSGVI